MKQRYRTFSEYLKERFPFKVKKIPIDAGFTCPNRDGSKGTGGCTYCDNRSFSPNARGPARSVREQIEAGIRFYREREGIEHFAAYFQAYTNTYAPVSELRRIFDEILPYREIVALSVGTRPDCVSEAVCRLLQDHGRERTVWLEMGLETSHDRTLALVNRLHTFEDFVRSANLAHSAGLEIVAHTIFGLPGENHEDMMLTVSRIAQLPVSHVKLHHLYISPGTLMAEQYARGEIRVMSLQEWTSLVADILERLPPAVTIQRLVGELGGPYVLAPLWGVSKARIHQMIDEELARRGTRQGAALIGA